MVFERLAADRDAVLKDDLGLSLGEGVTLKRITAVGEADFIIRPDLRHELLGQRAHGVNPFLMLIDIFEQCIHFCLVFPFLHSLCKFHSLVDILMQL